MRGCCEVWGIKQRRWTATSRACQPPWLSSSPALAWLKPSGLWGAHTSVSPQAAEEFSRFYREWCDPMLKGSALGQASVSPSLILLISTAGGRLWRPRVQSARFRSSPARSSPWLSRRLSRCLGTTAWAYQIAGAAALRIVNLLSVNPLPATGTLVPEAADIEIDDVCFSYGPTLALDHVSLRVPQGSITALVGSSGSGKSTLATLVARFADPDQGRIRIGGVDLRDVDPNALYKHVRLCFKTRNFLIFPCVTILRSVCPRPATRKSGCCESCLYR